jgi:hypothetical protein
MTRAELVRLAVLLNISDDYEEPVHVYEVVAYELGLCGLSLVPEETQKALIELTESGLAKAYYLGPGPGEELQGIPPFDGSHSYYFLITDDGFQTLAAWRKDWPFDDEGELIPGWSGLSD